jgi:hypothetical protein
LHRQTYQKKVTKTIKKTSRLMSKRTFKAAMKRNRVTAELSKIINKGKPNEIKLYNLYMDKPTAN